MEAQMIVRKISKNLGIDILEKSRKKEIVYGRWIAFKALDKLGYTLTEISKIIGMNHATVIYGLAQFKFQLRYRDFRELCDKSDCFTSEYEIATKYCNQAQYAIKTYAIF
jgi:hypothetical protein